MTRAIADEERATILRHSLADQFVTTGSIVAASAESAFGDVTTCSFDVGVGGDGDGDDAKFVG